VLESTAHVLLGAATALAWLGLGSLLLRRWARSGDSLLDALNQVGLGALAYGLLTFFAGWLGVLSPYVYVPVFAATAVLGALRASALLRIAPRPRPTTWLRWQQAAASVVAAYVAAAVVVTCAPVSSADALFYLAALPEEYERAGRIFEVTWVWQSYQPSLVQMLVLDGFLLWDSVQGAFAPLLLGVGAIVAVGHAGYRLGGRTLALLATLVFAAQPFALWLLTSTFSEPGGAFFGALALANVAHMAKTRRLDAAVLAGLFTGALASVKYVALAAAGVLGATVLAAAAASRRVPGHRLAVFSIAATLVVAPWFAKNVVLTGDPLYPYFGWPNEEARVENVTTFENFGRGRSPVDLVLLPVRLLADGESFNRAEYLSPLFLLFAPLALLDARARRVSLLVLAAVAVFVLAWFATAQDARYLFFALPPLALLSAVGMLGLASRGRLGRVVTAAVTVGALLAGALASAVYASRFVPVVVGAEGKDAFLRKTVPYHDGTIWLDREMGPGTAALLDHALVLQVDRPATAWTSDALPTTAGRRETVEFFREHGITHVLMFEANHARDRQLGYVGATPIARVTVRNVISRGLSRLGPPQTMVVYRVRPDRAA
jgi:hypothetical protein